MTSRTPRAERRTDALSKARIVQAAIEILDTAGENALTFRALTTQLSTGSGAIYHHVANKNELLTAATSDLIAGLTSEPPDGTDPREAIRSITLGVFDAIDTHPWLGTQLAREPWQPAVLLIFESLGRQIQALGVPEDAQFDSASALLNYVLGLAGQYAAGARLLPPGTVRSDFLGAVVGQWSRQSPAGDSFIDQMARQLRDHNDREQFLAGIDLILAGIATLT